MRLILSAAVFAVCAFIYWAIQHDVTGVMAWIPLPWQATAPLAVGVAFWLAAAWLLSRLLAETVSRWARRRHAEAQFPSLLIDVGALLLYAGAGLIITSQVFGISLIGLVATSGVAAAVIGLAVQKTISDVFAGISLNMDKSVKLGDWVQTGSGLPGRVTEISWRATRLEAIDGRTMVVPNSMLIGNQFTNWTEPDRHFRHTTTISVGYPAPAERVVLILQAAMEAAEGVRREPRPEVGIEQFADSGIVYSMNYWISDFYQLIPTSRTVGINALKFLDQAGYAPAFPVREIIHADRPHNRIERRIDVGVILRRTPFLQSFDEGAFALLERTIEPREFAAGATIIRKGDAGASLFIVVAGLLDVVDLAGEMELRKVGQLAPGDVFGEMSLLTGAPRMATVTAATAVTLLEIGKVDLEPVLADNPKVIAELSRLQSERIANNESILALWPEEQQAIRTLGMSAFLREKVGRFFSRSSRERGGDGGVVRARLPQDRS